MEQPNFLAVFVAGVIPMVFGFLWYGPLFGNMWMRLVETTEEEIRETLNPLKTYGVTFVLAVVMAYVLARIVLALQGAYEISGLMAGLQGGFWCWLGFVVVTKWQNVAFSDEKISVYALNMAFNLVSLLAMGALLGIWQ